MTLNETLRELLDRLDAHLPGERSHAERVAVMSVATGNALGIRGDELLTLRIASELHDIGKLSLPSGVRDWSRHPHLAKEVLGGRFAEAIPAIEAHHERWDGSGYPLKLEREAIPLAARIIGLAEFFDVAAYGAHWTAAGGEEAALNELRLRAGSLFDPKVVEAFLGVQPLIQPLGQ